MRWSPCNTLSAAALLAIMMLAGCSSVPLKSSSPQAKSTPSAHPILPPAGSGRGAYYKDDGPGDVTPEGLLELADAEPRVEPYSKGGSRPYVVFGKRYVPITHENPFTQRGRGSWYGKKFHGQKTASGELYDMYQMTAAHPTLPIPSYARVTNLSNGKQVIVRVNDRGPFHSGRVIDLSYTAALKLGYIAQGSAELQVERLLRADIEQIRAASTPAQSAATEAASATVQPAILTQQQDAAVSVLPGNGFYLQFGAYSQAGNAEVVRARLAQDVGHTLPQLKIETSDKLYRLYSGPFASRDEAAATAMQVQTTTGTHAFIVQR